jgi:hypothetical protein
VTNNVEIVPGLKRVSGYQGREEGLIFGKKPSQFRDLLHDVHLAQCQPKGSLVAGNYRNAKVFLKGLDYLERPEVGATYEDRIGLVYEACLGQPVGLVGFKPADL